MSQNEKEHLLTASVAESEARCRAEFERVFNATASGSDGLPLRGIERDMVRWGWNVCWNFLRRETEEWAQS